MITVPEALPLTMPLVALMEATAVLLLVHTPPVVALVSSVAVPTQTVLPPDTAAGNGFTEIMRVM